MQFVFGGDSQLVVNHAQAELCGTWNLNTVTTTIYGLTSALAVPGAPGGSVPAESGCVVAMPYPSGGTCAALLTTSAPNSVLFVQGTTYLPKAAVDVTLNNVTRQIFESGIFARTLFLTAPSRPFTPHLAARRHHSGAEQLARLHQRRRRPLPDGLRVRQSEHELYQRGGGVIPAGKDRSLHRHHQRQARCHREQLERSAVAVRHSRSALH